MGESSTDLHFYKSTNIIKTNLFTGGQDGKTS